MVEDNQGWLTSVPKTEEKPTEKLETEAPASVDWLTSVPQTEKEPKPTSTVSKAAKWVSDLFSRATKRVERTAEGWSTSVPESQRPQRGRWKHKESENGQPKKRGEKFKFRTREEQKALEGGQYAHLLQISPEELEKTIRRNSKRGPMGPRVLEIESVSLEVRGWPISVPYEPPPSEFVKNKNGIPIEGINACLVCGSEGRKNSVTCKRHASAEPWLQKPVTGPIQQIIAGFYLPQAAGLDDSVWGQIRTELLDGKRNSRRESGLEKARNRLKKYQNWGKKIIEKNPAAAWHPSFQEATDQLARVDWALQNLDFPSLPKTETELDKARDDLKETQNSLGIRVKRLKPPKREKETGNQGDGGGSTSKKRRRKTAAGCGKNAQFIKGSRWQPSEGQLETLEKLSRDLSCESQAEVTTVENKKATDVILKITSDATPSEPTNLGWLTKVPEMPENSENQPSPGWLTCVP